VARTVAELLLGEVLKLTRLQLYTEFDRPVTQDELDAYRALVKRRGNREPVAYILGNREFYGRPFAVDARVLVPRPDTETLVEAVLARVEPPDATVLDYGTGSGCIALTLLAERPGWKALAVDRSRDALDVARANAAALGLTERVGFVSSDGLTGVPHRFEGQLAALVANPPYVPLADRPGLAPEVRDHEPAEALHAGEDPLLHYRRLAAEGQRWLQPGGLLALEVGHDQAEAVSGLLREARWADVSIEQDLARIDRVVLGRRPGAARASTAEQPPGPPREPAFVADGAPPARLVPDAVLPRFDPSGPEPGFVPDPLVPPDLDDAPEEEEDPEGDGHPEGGEGAEER
jgi:release factor glutamine methyltransferase